MNARSWSYLSATSRSSMCSSNLGSLDLVRRLTRTRHCHRNSTHFCLFNNITIILQTTPVYHLTTATIKNLRVTRFKRALAKGTPNHRSLQSKTLASTNLGRKWGWSIGREPVCPRTFLETWLTWCSITPLVLTKMLSTWHGKIFKYADGNLN